MNNELAVTTESAVATMESRWQIAEKLVQCKLFPDYVKTAADIFILMDLAEREGKSIFQVANDNYIVKGKVTKKSEAVIRDINASGLLDGLLQFEEQVFKDETGKVTDIWVRAYGKEKATGQILYGTWITWQMANSEGWTAKEGSKWKTMPSQMFRYRAAAFWNRLYASQSCQLTSDEAEDIDIAPAAPVANSKMLDTSAIRQNALPANQQQPEAKPAAQVVEKPVEKSAAPAAAPVNNQCRVQKAF